MAGWMRQMVAGQRVEVDSDVVDALNARHALTWAVRTSSSTAESSG